MITRVDVERELARVPSAVRPVAAEPSSAPDFSLDSNRKETERLTLVKALSQTGNNRTRAARLLEVSRRTLYNKLREHGLE